MQLKPQDILLLLKLVVLGDQPWSQVSLAGDLGMSQSEVHGALKRAKASGLLVPGRERPLVNRSALLNFLIHGLPRVFFAERGALSRGMPTAWAAQPLCEKLQVSEDPPLVWPHPEGPVRGESLKPLYRSAPEAARKDPGLYELLCLIDALRAGRARERSMAEKHLKRLLKPGRKRP